MLFTVPKSRPSRLYKPVGPGFGRDKLKPPASLSDTPGTECVSLCVTMYVLLTIIVYTLCTNVCLCMLYVYPYVCHYV